MRKIDPIQIEALSSIQNMSAIAKLLEETRGGRKEEKKDGQ
jgi:hypothetical protein